MIGRWTIRMMPEQITKARRRGTHIRMRVMSVNAPSLQRPLHDEVMPRTSDVIHDFFAAAFLNRFADAGSERLQNFVPRGSSPLPCTSFSDALHRIQNAIGIVNLIDRGGPFC